MCRLLSSNDSRSFSSEIRRKFQTPRSQTGNYSAQLIPANIDDCFVFSWMVGFPLCGLLSSAVWQVVRWAGWGDVERYVTPGRCWCQRMARNNSQPTLAWVFLLLCRNFYNLKRRDRGIQIPGNNSFEMPLRKITAETSKDKICYITV